MDLGLLTSPDGRLQMIFATITLTELLIVFSLPEYFIVCYPTSTTPTLTMLPLPKPTDFAVDFPTVARSVAFGIVFREFTTTLNPMAMPRGIEPRSPERQSGIITAIRWHQRNDEGLGFARNISVPKVPPLKQHL